MTESVFPDVFRVHSSPLDAHIMSTIGNNDVLPDYYLAITDGVAPNPFLASLAAQWRDELTSSEAAPRCRMPSPPP